MEPKYLLLKDACEKYRVPANILRKFCQSGAVDARKISSTWYIAEDALRTHILQKDKPSSSKGEENDLLMLTCKHLERNDRVRVLTNLVDPQTSLLSVTADSIGRIISFEQYRAYIKREFDGQDTPASRRKHFSQIAKELQDDRAFLVRIDNFAPVSDSSSPSFLEAVVLIKAQYLEKLEP